MKRRHKKRSSRVFSPKFIAISGIFIILVLCNVYIIYVLPADGKIDGIENFYIWFFDCYVLLIGVAVHVTSKQVKKLMLSIIFAFTVFGCLEFTAILVFRHTYKFWHFKEENFAPSMFIRHPYLVGTPRPNAILTGLKGESIFCNSYGYRGKEFNIQKLQGVKRVVTIGGGTTFCTGVDNDDTWPEYLEHFLGKTYEVINLGVPGYNSVEHIIQTALLLDHLQPDIVLYYMGWNDMQSINIQYNSLDYHGKRQYKALNLPKQTWKGPNLAIMHLLIDLFVRYDWLLKTPVQTLEVHGGLSSEIDSKALDTYRRNVALLINLCRTQQFIPIMIPQVLNYRQLTSTQPYGWLPYVRDCDVKEFAGKYNQEMKHVAFQENAFFIEEVLQETWEADDFVDNGHFSAHGNMKFAMIIARYLLQKEL